MSIAEPEKPGEERCIEVTLRVIDDCRPDLQSRLQDWVDCVWMPNNATWERVWKTGTNWSVVAKREILRFDHDFSRAPQASPMSDMRLSVKIYVRWPSRNWKDWFV